MVGRLFVCATPIGNLEDVTFRLLRVLGEVNVVAAEDTRRTRKLLTHHGVRAKLVSYHEGNERARAADLLERMRRGERVALVSESGMPAIADPGYQIVQACIGAGIPIEVVPGPSAVLAALAVSGLPTARFAFEGFLPKKAGERLRRLRAVSDDDRTLVFFEAPGRVAASLRDLQTVLGDRAIALVREITKVHEEVVRGRISEVLEAAGDVKGEVVLVVEGKSRGAGDLEAAVAAARRLVGEGVPKAKAAAETASAMGVARREVYEALTRGG